MLVDRGDGWHTARLDVDRNDMGDVMADLADPCETLGFGHGGQVTAITKRLSF